MKGISHLHQPGHRSSRPDTTINPASRVEVKRITDFPAELQAQINAIQPYKAPRYLPTTAPQSKASKGRR